MKTFSGIKFDGTFRDYQQEILNKANYHLKDGRIHIVAAPGSGKTILGLELIRGLGKPALVMSPSVTIRQQWGERFVQNYMPADKQESEYISYNLKAPSLITSITYQALHAAVTSSVIEEETDSESLETESAVDFSDFDLLETIKKAGITTICLDEAHHLKSEWQRALEKFIEALGTKVTVIALTATPPYDSNPAEWNRYSKLCGEIDEEIFVPQLVSQKTLCPHQDYIYFNYPTDAETEALRTYKEKAVACSERIIKSVEFKKSIENSGLISNYKNNEEFIFDNLQAYISLVVTANKSGIVIPSGVLSFISQNKKIPRYSISHAQTAFQFIIDNPEIFTEEYSESLKSELMQEALIEKRKVQLKTNEKLNKMLISSVGKLDSINKIAESEFNNLGKELRLLILTDYIKKDMKKLIGTDEDIHAIGTVPVFESLRRCCDESASIALLSGTLVILPNSVLNVAEKIAKEDGVEFLSKPIENTSHSEVRFSGSNKNKVSIITKIFQSGYLNILIGTKSLLGEGWDSPAINSLILASFVGSFMLSNQMRGRAIRIDKTKPEKASNIWHLVTVEPNSDTEKLVGTDFDTVSRRFDCFLAPAYNEDVIESGLDRIDIIKPPFDENGINRINSEMLTLSADRKIMSGRWNAAVRGEAKPEIVEMNEVPAEVQPKKFLYRNIVLEVILIAIIFVALIGIISGSVSTFGKIISILVIAVSVVLSFGIIKKIISHSKPEKSVSTLANVLLKTLKKTVDIESEKAEINVRGIKNGIGFSCSLSGATLREKNIFSSALSEMLSPIDDPRYVIIKKTKLFSFVKLNYSQSYACPSIIGTKKEKAQILADNLKRSSGDFELVFTRSENGMKALQKCKKLSYINVNGKLVKAKKSVK